MEGKHEALHFKNVCYLRFPTILGSMMVVFLIIRSIPGDPVAMKFGKSATVQEIEEYREEYGYNRPMAVQMVDSIIDTFRGDLGYSMANNQPVFDMILTACRIRWN